MHSYKFEYILLKWTFKVNQAPSKEGLVAWLSLHKQKRLAYVVASSVDPSRMSRQDQDTLAYSTRNYREWVNNRIQEME